MSRTVKFRAWVPQFESYGEVLNILFSEEGLPEIIEVFIDGSNHHLNAFEVILEQYTGLKDKNGEEIYEGDIVLDYYDGEDAFIVKWDKDTASFILDNIAIVGFDNFYSDEDLKVIGNIHENPELLGGEE